ncbi:MAG: cytochrome c oxidase subunit 2A [Actinomycetota bacterium]|nr:cytochrome c oxidase subunit 2A [Actinomycetota bacterium]
MTVADHDETGTSGEEHFKPVGTIFVLVLFVATIILLWASVYVILLSRGVTL